MGTTTTLDTDEIRRLADELDKVTQERAEVDAEVEKLSAKESDVYARWDAADRALRAATGRPTPEEESAGDLFSHPRAVPHKGHVKGEILAIVAAGGKTPVARTAIMDEVMRVRAAQAVPTTRLTISQALKVLRRERLIKRVVRGFYVLGDIFAPAPAKPPVAPKPEAQAELPIVEPPKKKTPAVVAVPRSTITKVTTKGKPKDKGKSKRAAA